MSREIKFRAWDTIGNCWVRDALLQDWIIIGVPDGENNNGVFDVSTWTGDRLKLMQYIRLQDKNGVEIYEGDIVNVSTYARDIYATVKFEEGRFYLATGEDTEYDLKLYQEDGYYPSFSWSECQVIGNIYENPELIKWAAN